MSYQSDKSYKNKKLALTGGAAAAEALRQINPDVAPVYPITPQTPIIETFAKFQAERLVDTEIIPVESEHSMMSACVGASAAGARTVTASSSQGIALMNEILPIASGMRLPILMVVSARALSAPINIHCDHSDMMSVRDTGWIQIFSENVQEAYDNVIIGLKLAEKVKMPVMVAMDGFVTSHCVENLEILPDEAVKEFIGEFIPDQPLLDAKIPVTYGPVGLPDSYFEFKIDQAEAMKTAFGTYLEIAKEFKKISGREYGLFYDYLCKGAENILVIMGSSAGTARVVVDRLRDVGKKVGVLKIKLFRPFPHKEIAEVLKSAKNIAVLDRAMSLGTHPPIMSEIINAINSFNKPKNCKVKIGSFVYGLGGRDLFQKDIEKVFEDLIAKKISKEIKFIANK
jgi:pyruvate ferredoxin oxidoreductase alpha subunit